MKKRKNERIEAEVKRLKKIMLLPKKAKVKALYSDIDEMCNQDNLDAYIKKHRKEIGAIKKRVSARKIIRIVRTTNTAK